MSDSEKDVGSSSENVSEQEVSSEKQFYKIVKDFVRDILITFPEYKHKLVPGIINITLDKEDEQTKITPLLESCLKLGLEFLYLVEEEEYQQLMDNSTCPLRD